MPQVTVLIPTFDHADTLTVTLESVLAQTLQDFEVFVVGDGAPDRTREIMAEFCQRDARIRFFDYPKGERNGELHRHNALQQAAGHYVCYLADDDLWLPHHLEVLTKLLEKADFAHTLHTVVHPDRRITANSGDLNDKATRERILKQRWNFFGPTVAGHTLASYRNLPEGWRPAPPATVMWSDLYMWRQILSQPNMRFLSNSSVTTLHFPSPHRLGQSPEQRTEELHYWWNWLQQKPNALTLINNQVLNDLNAKIVQFQNQQVLQNDVEKNGLQNINQAIYQGLRWNGTQAVLLSGPPAAKHSNIEIVEFLSNGIYLRGWAYDASARRPFVCICVFSDSVLIRVVSLSLNRPDVDKYLGIEKTFAGFECHLPLVDSLVVLALSHTGQFFPLVDSTKKTQNNA